MRDLVDTFPIDLDHVFLIPAVPTSAPLAEPATAAAVQATLRRAGP